MKTPYVVLLVMDVGGAPAFRCSATMLTPTVVLTAGHCTNGFPDFEFTGMRIFTQSDVGQGRIDGTNNYPLCGGPNCFEAVDWAAHPLYETGPFFLHDVGVVILEKPGFNPGVFAGLPDTDQCGRRRDFVWSEWQLRRNRWRVSNGPAKRPGLRERLSSIGRSAPPVQSSRRSFRRSEAPRK